MATKKGQPDTDLTSADIEEIEKTLPRDVREAETRFLKLTQNGKKPCWIRVWRRKGLTSVLDFSVEPPYRRGEPALVENAPQSMRIGEAGEAPVWRLKYGDRINSAYPQDVVLPIMEYVWDLKSHDEIGTSYVVRKEKGK